MSLSTYRVAARRVAPDVSTGSTRNAEIRFDTGADLSEDLFGPADLLAAAFAACMLKNVERFSGILPFRYDDAAVDVTLEREDRPPRITRVTYELRLATDEPADRVDLLGRNLRQFGTIYNTLSQACAVSGAIVVQPRT
ncbi:MAG: OsmC family protein [Chloroflexota bacterium]